MKETSGKFKENGNANESDRRETVKCLRSFRFSAKVDLSVSHEKCFPGKSETAKRREQLEFVCVRERGREPQRAPRRHQKNNEFRIWICLIFKLIPVCDTV